MLCKIAADDLTEIILAEYENQKINWIDSRAHIMEAILSRLS